MAKPARTSAASAVFRLFIGFPPVSARVVARVLCGASLASCWRAVDAPRRDSSGRTCHSPVVPFIGPDLSQQKPMRILIVEDARTIADAAAAPLMRAGHAVDVVGTGEGAQDALAVQAYDLIILDLGLPDIDARRCSRAGGARGDGGADPRPPPRARRFPTTASPRSTRARTITFIKPFESDELAATLPRAAAPGAGGRPHDALRIGSLVLDRGRRTVTIDGAPVELPKREFRLLRRAA